MKNAFTLIELIFVIVIIGVLAAVAIPKFTHLKANSKVVSIINLTLNSAKKAVESAANMTYIDNNDTFKLNDIIHLEGKGWKYNNSYKDGDYYYPNSEDKSIADIILDKTDKEIQYRVNCNAFDTQTEQKICEKYIKPTGDVANPYPYKTLTY